MGRSGSGPPELVQSRWHHIAMRCAISLLLSLAATLLWTARSLPQDWASGERAWSHPEAEGLASPRIVHKHLRSAYETMQTRFFDLRIGTWPESIDWTGAVIGTQLVAALSASSRRLKRGRSARELLGTDASPKDGRLTEGHIATYFAHTIGYHYGEKAEAIALQAFDDMLWVALGWLEALKFSELHAELHYPAGDSISWFGEQYEAVFAHRAARFWSLAERGWDTSLCGGGMLWNPYLFPYKNAITNQLFIAASGKMYLHYSSNKGSGRYQKKYLDAAVKGYEWLSGSNMTNDRGLYIDGFHVSGWGLPGSPIGSGKCDVRNEMLYTYNQGVILSGLRNLWEGTGNQTYLHDGHQLVRNVIAATGWQHRSSDRWAGLGRRGILHELCDESGMCNQDAQTFKGIFFHHLALFCEKLPRRPKQSGKTFGADRETFRMHRRACRDYLDWISFNTHAALGTRDRDGVFGGWWGAGVKNDGRSWTLAKGSARITNATDYRNNLTALLSPEWSSASDPSWPLVSRYHEQKSISRRSTTETGAEIPWSSSRQQVLIPAGCDQTSGFQEEGDPNDRGRGRTVETQSGGVAVLRALSTLLEL